MRGLGVAISLTVLVAVSLIVDARVIDANVHRLVDAHQRVEHTREVIEQFHELLTVLQDAETAERGFIITLEGSYQTAYERARADALERNARIERETQDNPAQQRRAVAIRQLVAQKLALMDRAIELRRTGEGGFEPAQALVRSGEATRIMAAVRQLTEQSVELERRFLADRIAAAARAASAASLSNVLGLATGLALLLAAFVAWRRRTSEREHAARLLHAEAERFRVTLSSIGDGVIVTDAQARIAMLNPTASAVLGWDGGALGRPIDEVFQIVNEETRRPVESPVHKVLREGRVAGLANHTVVVRRDGTETPIDDSGAPIRDQHGNTLGVVLVFRDIRERREAERELRRRADLLEEQDQRKDRFLASLSHELRNQLAPVRNAASVLDCALADSAESRRSRLVIQRQVTHITRLVDDLLDVSRIAQGKLRLDREPLDLAELVRQTVEDHRSLFSSKAVTLECAGLDHLWVEGDPTRLAQLTENLLHNAAKFTSRGDRVHVTITTEEGRAAVRVCDTGLGIAKDALPRLFIPFMQAEGTLHRSQSGLGLGLALAKSIVEFHGGTIQARSEGPGRGAEFIVSLPLGRNTAAPLRRVHPAPTMARLRICVIDDNVDAAETLRDLLALEGHEVYVAYEGGHGIELTLERHPDLVLCDLQLPDVDGLDVARRLKEAGATATLVAISGYATSDDVQRAHDAGFDHHVPKPASLDHLHAVLAQAAARRDDSSASAGGRLVDDEHAHL